MFEVEGLRATYDNPQGLGTRLSFPLGLGRVPGTVPSYLPTRTYFSPQQRELLYRWGNRGLKRSRGLPKAVELANGRARISSGVRLGCAESQPCHLEWSEALGPVPGSPSGLAAGLCGMCSVAGRLACAPAPAFSLHLHSALAPAGFRKCSCLLGRSRSCPRIPCDSAFAPSWRLLSQWETDSQC